VPDTKTCPICDSLLAANLWRCPKCGTNLQIPKSAPKHDQKLTIPQRLFWGFALPLIIGNSIAFLALVLCSYRYANYPTLAYFASEWFFIGPRVLLYAVIVLLHCCPNVFN